MGKLYHHVTVGVDVPKGSLTMEARCTCGAIFVAVGSGLTLQIMAWKWEHLKEVKDGSA